MDDTFDLCIEEIYEDDDDDCVGYYSQGFHAPDAFMAALNEYCDISAWDHAAVGMIADRVRYGWQRSEYDHEDYQEKFFATTPETPEAYPITILRISDIGYGNNSAWQTWAEVSKENER